MAGTPPRCCRTVRITSAAAAASRHTSAARCRHERWAPAAAGGVPAAARAAIGGAVAFWPQALPSGYRT